MLHDGAQIGTLNAVPIAFPARRSTELVMPVALRGLQMSVMSGWVRDGWAELSFDGAAELTYLGFPLTQRVNFTRRMEVVASELTRQAVGAQAARRASLPPTRRRPSATRRRTRAATCGAASPALLAGFITRSARSTSTAAAQSAASDAATAAAQGAADRLARWWRGEVKLDFYL